METEQALKDDEFKKAILKRFQVISEVYRVIFRGLRMNDKMSHRENVYNFCDLLRKWAQEEEGREL